MCSPSRGAGRSARHRLAVDHDRRADAGNGAGLGQGARQVELHAAMLDVRVVEHLIEIVDRAGRHADRFELVGQILHLELHGQRGELADELGAVGEPRLVVDVARVLRQLRRAEHAAQLDVLAVVAGGDDDVAVGDREHLIGHDVGMRVADALGHLAGGEIVQALVGQHADGGIDQRGVDVAALAGALALRQRGEDADHRIDAGEDVGHRHAGRVGSPSAVPVRLMKPPMPCAIRS